MREIATASDSMMTQADQTTRAIKEQARTMKDMTGAANTTLKQIKLITHANREHSTVSASLMTSLAELRQIADRNAGGVKRTRGGTDDLLRRANALIALVERPVRRRTTAVPAGLNAHECRCPSRRSA